jgi:V8-like Glu-specific endopeptidase
LPVTPPSGPLGWSNGVDTRILRTPTSLWPWRAIAQFRYGNTDESRCTGTLIGPRHLVTAAHCINEKGTNNWYTIRVAPGKNGVGVEPYGNSIISLTPPPGKEAWYFTPDPWRNPATAASQWDWGLIVIPDRLGDLTGWMGYFAGTGNYLKTVSNYNRGYPLCNTDRNNEPAGCQDSRLYGDTNLCGIGGFYDPGPDGWNRRIAVSCDLSAGHSGSAVYHYYFDPAIGQYWPVVTMMVITESCTTCGPLDNYPNRARRITPGDLGTISWLRETFP